MVNSSDAYGGNCSTIIPVFIHLRIKILWHRLLTVRFMLLMKLKFGKIKNINHIYSRENISHLFLSKQNNDWRKWVYIVGKFRVIFLFYVGYCASNYDSESYIILYIYVQCFVFSNGLGIYSDNFKKHYALSLLSSKTKWIWSLLSESFIIVEIRPDLKS